MSVKRIGLSKFLADIFINNLTGVLTPDMLIKNYQVILVLVRLFIIEIAV